MEKRTECPKCGFPMATEADDDALAAAAFESGKNPSDMELFGDVLCWDTFVLWHRTGELADALKVWRQKALALQKQLDEVSK